MIRSGQDYDDMIIDSGDMKQSEKRKELIESKSSDMI